MIMKYPKKKWMRKKFDPKKVEVEYYFGKSALKPYKDCMDEKLINRLDRVFSEYIRLYYANKDGVCRCITCKRPFFWKQIDAGHFIQRDRKATRYDEKNVHPQCSSCNRFKSGEQYAHGKEIDILHGKGTAERLRVISQMRGAKLPRSWLEYHLKIYRQKVKKLKEEKGNIIIE